MRETPSPSARIETLEREMSPNDIRCLKESEFSVRRFLAVAGKIGFFQRSPDSDQAGYDIATHNLLPEAPLASLVHADRSKEEPMAFADQWHSRAQGNPRAFIQLMIAENKRLGEQYTARTGNAGTLGVDVALEELENVKDQESVANLQSVLVNCPPPDEELPAWFQVMRRYQLMPGDVEQVLSWSIEDPNQVGDHILRIQGEVQQARVA